MSSVATIAFGTAVVGAAVSSDSSRKAAHAQQDAANRATDAQLSAQEQSNALQEKIYNETTARNEPWRQAGLGGLAYMTGTPVQYQQAIPEAELRASYDKYKTDFKPTSSGTERGSATWADILNGGGINGSGSTTSSQPLSYDDWVKNQTTTRTVSTGIKSAAGTTAADDSRAFTTADFTQDPGYQYRLQQGLKAIQGTAAARGSLMSGRTLKALDQYGTDQANQYYTQERNNFQALQDRNWNRQAGLAGIGQTTTQQQNAAASSYAGNVGSGMTAIGNAIGASQIAQGNAAAQNSINQSNVWTNALNQGSRLYGQYMTQPSTTSNSSWYPSSSSTAPVNADYGFGSVKLGGG